MKPLILILCLLVCSSAWGEIPNDVIYLDVDDYGEIILRLAQQMFRTRQDKSKKNKIFNIAYRRPLPLSKIVSTICETMGFAQPKKIIPIRPKVPKIVRLLPFAGADSLAARFELIGLSQYFNVDALSTQIAPDIAGKDPQTALKKSLLAYT